MNQSWRGGISRILGHDAGYGPLVLAALAVTAVLALLAWRALADDDRLGRIVVVMTFGLLLSPISWSHHWAWLVPAIVWLVHGPLSRWLAGLGWFWLILALIGPPTLLLYAQPTIWEISRPWYLAWAGLAYVAPAMVTLALVAIIGRRSSRSRPPLPDPSA